MRKIVRRSRSTFSPLELRGSMLPGYWSSLSILRSACSISVEARILIPLLAEPEHCATSNSNRLRRRTSVWPSRWRFERSKIATMAGVAQHSQCCQWSVEQILSEAESEPRTGEFLSCLRCETKGLLLASCSFSPPPPPVKNWHRCVLFICGCSGRVCRQDRAKTRQLHHKVRSLCAHRVFHSILCEISSSSRLGQGQGDFSCFKVVQLCACFCYCCMSSAVLVILDVSRLFGSAEDV